MELHEIYKKLYRWQLDEKTILSTKKEISDLESGKKPENDPFDLRSLDGEITTEREISDCKKAIEQLISEQMAIEEQLKNVGIDAEFTVTKAFPELSKGYHLYNYYIKRAKVENRDLYEYEIYNNTEGNDGKNAAAIETFDTLESAVREVLSYYDYLDDKMSYDEAIKKVRTEM